LSYISNKDCHENNAHFETNNEANKLSGTRVKEVEAIVRKAHPLLGKVGGVDDGYAGHSDAAGTTSLMLYLLLCSLGLLVPGTVPTGIVLIEALPVAT
jgi:hypothetical protein